MSNRFVAVLRFFGFLAWTLLLLLPYLALLAGRWKGYAAYAHFYFRGVTRICGFHVVVHGAPPRSDTPVLFVSNHVSYIDIIVLGSVIKTCFIAKAEVAKWPGFGFLARIAQTAFVDRKRSSTGREMGGLRQRLSQGDSLVLFAEGTSSDGNRVLPFKSALFAVAEASDDSPPLTIQPISLAYTRLDGQPMGRAMRPFYAWYGDMTLADHLFCVLGLGEATVEIIFHPPVSIADFSDRKALANHCHDQISRGVTLSLAGRLDGLRPGKTQSAPCHP